MRCPSQGAPSAREMTIGRGFPSPDQPDNGRTATYRAGSRRELCRKALCATVIGSRGESSGKFQLTPRLFRLIFSTVTNGRGAKSMAKWTAPREHEPAPPPPPRGATEHPRPHHLTTYEGLEHVSGQLEQVLQGLSEIRSLIAESRSGK